MTTESANHASVGVFGDTADRQSVDPHNKAGTRTTAQSKFGPEHNATLDTSEHFTTEPCGD